jgi:hypothetical protein
MDQENYIQYLSGHSKENISIEDVKMALAELPQMDEEHGAFWVAVIKNEENVLEVHKDLSVIGIFEEDLNKEYRKLCRNIQEVEVLYSLLLNEEFSKLKKQFELE